MFGVSLLFGSIQSDFIPMHILLLYTNITTVPRGLCHSNITNIILEHLLKQLMTVSMSRTGLTIIIPSILMLVTSSSCYSLPVLHICIATITTSVASHACSRSHPCQQSSRYKRILTFAAPLMVKSSMGYL